MVDLQILTTGQIAQRWHRSIGYIRRLIHDGKLLPLPRYSGDNTPPRLRRDRAWYVVDLPEVLRFEPLELEKQKHEDEVRFKNLKITLVAKALGGIDRRYAKIYFEPEPSDEPPDLWQPV